MKASRDTPAAKRGIVKGRVGPTRGAPAGVEMGVINVAQVAQRYDVRAQDLVVIAGAPRSAARSDRVRNVKTQQRLREMVEILRLVEPLTGGPESAMAWYKSQPLPGFARTAEQLVKDGYSSAVRDYLDEIALGGFA